MAIIELGQRAQGKLDAVLLQPIEDELRRSDSTPAPSEAPIIYREESNIPENYTNWYVVWDKFQNVDDEERSRLILNAIENVLGKAEALRVTIAMGLTPAEAKNIGLSPPSSI